MATVDLAQLGDDKFEELINDICKLNDIFEILQNQYELDDLVEEGYEITRKWREELE